MVAGEVVNLDDVRVLEGRYGLRLELETLADVGVLLHVLMEDFDGDFTAELLVYGDVDIRHPTLADPVEDTVAVAEKLVPHESLPCGWRSSIMNDRSLA